LVVSLENGGNNGICLSRSLLGLNGVMHMRLITLVMIHLVILTTLEEMSNNPVLQGEK
jgi:hypothetical protein